MYFNVRAHIKVVREILITDLSNIDAINTCVSCQLVKEL